MKQEFIENGKKIKVKLKKTIRKKTKMTLVFDEELDGVDFHIKMKAKPFRVLEEGLNVQDDNIFSVNFSVTKKF